MKLGLGLILLAAALPAAAADTPGRTQVVLLGTGTPPADPDRSGPATAVVVNDTAYLVDMGAGIVRRAKSAVVDKGVAALDPAKLRVVFVTHLHSDHTVGYPAAAAGPVPRLPVAAAGRRLRAVLAGHAGAGDGGLRGTGRRRT